MRLTKVLAVVSAVLLLFAGCGNGDDDPSASGAEQSATPQPTPCAVSDADREAKTVKSESGVAPVTDVRTSSEGCPRIVFEFQDQTPGYDIRYVEPPVTDCGQGAEVDVSSWDADAYLNVKLEPAASIDLQAQQTYNGPRDFAVDSDILRHMKAICDYEADFTWLVGLDAEHDFKVTTFEDPPRVVIDISGTG